MAARFVAEQCAAAGIEINVIERPYAEYMSLLSANNFQLYLGEVKILPNMDMSQLVTRGGSAAFGVGREPIAPQEGAENAEPSNTATVCEGMIAAMRQGQINAADLAGALITEMPQIPVCYRNGTLFYSSDISGEVTAVIDDIYCSIHNFTLKNK